MKIKIQWAIVGMILLAGCSKTEPRTTIPITSTTSSSLSASPNGNSGITLVYYDAKLVKMNLNPFSAQAAASLLAHNSSINILYERTGFVTVTDAIQGDGYNPIWQEVDIVFNNGFTPHQFLSDTDVLDAAAANEITLVPTNKIFRCDIIQHTKVQ